VIAALENVIAGTGTALEEHAHHRHMEVFTYDYR
jgi:hypothetical protein